jgi:catecholate siderophore receptor
VKKITQCFKAEFKFKRIPMTVLIALAGMPPQAAAEETEGKQQDKALSATGDVQVVQQMLPEIRVNAAKESSYKADTSTTGLKFEAPLRDIPQSINVVKEELIRSQNAFNLGDALRNVSGLTIAAGEGGRTGDSITLRGFAAHSDTYQDGAKENGQYFRDTFFMERVEVLKGSSSVLFGRGATGGIINTVTKKPVSQGDPFASADFTYGAFDFKRATADVGMAPTENISFRLNALYQDADSYRNFNFTNRWGIAPSVRFDFTPDTNLVLHLLHQHEDSVFDYGVPIYQGRPADVSIKRFYGFGEDRLQKIDATIATATLTHHFSSDFTVRNTFRYGNYDRRYRTHLFGAVTEAGADSTAARTQALRDSPQENFFNQTDFSFNKPILGFNNTLYFGTEIGWEDFTFRSKNSTGVGSISIFNPVLTSTVGTGRANDFSGTLATNRSITLQTIAGYVLNQFEITPQLKLLGGTRYDVLEAKQMDRLTNTELSNKVNEFSPRAGIVWQPASWQSHYFSYGKSFNPSAETFNLSAATTGIDPEQNQNFEMGTKLDFFNNRLSLTGAIFRLEKTNARTTNPNDPLLNVLAGEQRTDGIEFGLAGELLPNWNLSAVYAYLDAEIIKSNTMAVGTISGINQSLQGKKPINVPDHSGTVWTSYRITPQWEIAGGVFFASSRYADNVNEVTLPGYARVDASVSYIHKHFTLQGNVFNLFDEKYYQSGQARSALPGVPLTGQISVRLRF